MPSWTPSVPPKNSCARALRPPGEGPGRVERLPDGTNSGRFPGTFTARRGGLPGPGGVAAAEASWSVACACRRVRKPAAPAAISSSATAPSTISGTGTRVGAAGLRGVEDVAERGRSWTCRRRSPWVPPPLLEPPPFDPPPAPPVAVPPPALVPPVVVVAAAGALRDPLLERLLDVVARARVRVDVGRQVLERLAVAVDRVGAVDPAVVPVVDQRLPAGRLALCRDAGATPAPSRERQSSSRKQDERGDVPGRMDHEKRGPLRSGGGRRFAFDALYLCPRKLGLRGSLERCT